jgi:hypothetical protein
MSMSEEAQKDTNNTKLTLDGAEITADKLEEAKKNQAVRIIETGEGTHKTLQHLRE